MADPAHRQRDRVVDLLPEVIRTTATPGSPLAALGAAADDLHAPVLDVLDRLDDVVDPARAPARFIRYLAGWVDLGWVAAAEGESGARAAGGVTVTRLRDVLAASADLSARRGTPGGLARFLHLATGVEGFGVEPVEGEFHVRVLVPAGASDQVELVEHLVQGLRPAHVTSEVLLGGGAAPTVATGPAAPSVAEQPAALAEPAAFSESARGSEPEPEPQAEPATGFPVTDEVSDPGDEPSPPVAEPPELPLAPAPDTFPPAFPPDPAARRARAESRDGPPPPPPPPGG